MTDRPIERGGRIRLPAPLRRACLITALIAIAESPVANAAESPAANAAESRPESTASVSSAGGHSPETMSAAAKLTAMGKFFELSEPPSQDYERARDLYCRAAADAHPEALQRLGWLYLKGHGVAVSEQVAGTLFRWAAELGDARAAGLSAALPAPIELSPPCLVQRGLTSSDTIRARQRALLPPPAPVPAPVPTPVVENPVQFRAAAPSIDQRRIVQMVVQSAREFRLDPRLVIAVMRMESNFDPLARSPKNAQGLMQLIPETAQRFNVRDAFDPTDNLRGGMAYLRWLLAYYRGDVPLALAAYNAGEGAVDRHRGVPPFPETIAYVQRIRAMYPFDRHPFDTRALAGGEGSWIHREVADATPAPGVAR
jgi:soluble lytic murein transglycosylase-like protein